MFFIETELDQFKDIETPQELYKVVTGMISYKHNGRFNTVDDVLKNKSGDCHDQSYLLQCAIRKMGYKTCRIFMVEYHDWGKAGGATHTLCWYVDKAKYFWIETAWGDQLGIHGPYKSIDELKLDVLSKWNWSGDNDKLYMTSTSIKPPMSFGEFVERCTPEHEPKAYHKQ